MILIHQPKHHNFVTFGRVPPSALPFPNSELVLYLLHGDFLIDLGSLFIPIGFLFLFVSDLKHPFGVFLDHHDPRHFVPVRKVDFIGVFVGLGDGGGRGARLLELADGGHNLSLLGLEGSIDDHVSADIGPDRGIDLSFFHRGGVDSFLDGWLPTGRLGVRVF